MNVDESFKSRAHKIVALSQLSQIMLHALSLSTKDPESEFTKYFTSISDNLFDGHHTNREISAPGYKAVGFMDGLTLIMTISELELFFQEVVIASLVAHPQKMTKTSIEIKQLINYSSIDDALRATAEGFANGLMFKKPNDYKKSLLSIISADEKLLDDFWPTFVEAKARRDIGVHNDWEVNDIYINKVKEVGLTPTTEPFLAVNQEYILSVRVCCIDIMKAIKNHYERTFS